MSIPPESQTPDDDVPSGNGPSASERTGRALELLAQVRSGVVPGSMLQADARQSLVVLLTADGVSSHEIAQILQVSDRTIERDRRAIRAGAAVSKDPKLVGEMVGRLMAEAELSIQRIRRTARERDVDAGIKVDAEHRCAMTGRGAKGLRPEGMIRRRDQETRGPEPPRIVPLPWTGRGQGWQPPPRW